MDGLKLGANTLSAGGKSLTLANYSIKGPIISGAQIKPFYCETETFKLPGYAPAGGQRGSDAGLTTDHTLGKPIDADCSVKTRVDYVYMSKTSNEFAPLADPKSTPADLATTTTSTGATVPFIVRVETGTIIAASTRTPSCSIPPATWARRLFRRPRAGTII